MAGTLEKELTDENIFAYAQAFFDIGLEMGLRIGDGFENVLIPSRGAYPFYNFANQWVMFNGASKKHNEITLPFTADYTQSVTGSFDESEELQAKTRSYWVDVFCSMLTDKGRPFQFYKYLMEHVMAVPTLDDAIQSFSKTWEFRSPLLEHYIPNVKGDPKKTIYIDTLRSGKSAYTILKAMEKRGIQPFAILVCDEMGERLRYPYKQYLDTVVNSGRGAYIRIPKLFTEDRGPSMVGVTSVVFPGIISAASETGFSGAGVYQMAPKEDDSLWGPLKNFNPLKGEEHEEPIINASSGMNAVLFAASQLLYQRKGQNMFSRITPEMMDEIYHTCRRYLIQKVESENLLTPQRTADEYKTAFKRYRYPVISANVTGSHVIKVEFSEQDTQKIVDGFVKRAQ